ncbi:protein of unknown function [Cupriavidus taiwanensis]|uniref:Uncharacterized protein n=1 Tax=Cupriavidus taiwanensis TaxID=164546 RepID=A0A9Q7XUZ0_9BURK|nr:protein of unknown function [Cupriavidus taiwanensis]
MPASAGAVFGRACHQGCGAPVRVRKRFTTILLAGARLGGRAHQLAQRPEDNQGCR